MERVRGRKKERKEKGREIDCIKTERKKKNNSTSSTPLGKKKKKNSTKACARYAAAELRGPAPPGALYNHAVALTDFSRIPPGEPGDGGSDPSAREAERTRRARLREAAAKYHQAISEEASSRSPSSSSSSAAAAAAAAAPELSSPHGGSSSSPQALNNLGLVLQELSAFEPAGSKARAALAAAAAARFRAAARGRPDFERAVYNLGTVLYASAPPAVAVSSASANASSSSVPSTPSSSAAAPSPPSSSSQQQQNRAEALADAAQCVALAAALAPSAPVYARSLALVQPFLPLPRLRAGWLLVPDPLPLGTSSSSQQQQGQGQPTAGGSAPPFFLPGSVTAVGRNHAAIFPSARERFVARWCVIDAEALRATVPPADAPAAPRGWEDENGASPNGGGGGEGHGGGSSSSDSSNGNSSQRHYHFHHAPRPMRVPLAEILSAAPAADASLPAPAGAGLHLRFASCSSSSSSSTSSKTTSSSSIAPPAGCFLVAPSHASAEAWADALCVAGHVARSSPKSSGGGSAALARVLAPAVGTVAGANTGTLAHRRPSSSGLAR